MPPDTGYPSHLDPQAAPPRLEPGETPPISRRTRGDPPREGEQIELRWKGILIRRGTVETTMPDGSGFWTAAHGADGRIFVHFAYDELEVWSQR